MTFYNPHLLPRKELIETFVARQPLLGELLDDLRRGGGQHHLLIGGRGTGKTTLLLRIAAAIEDDPKLARRCIALRFPEEQYNISRPSDFWINALDALIDALVQHDERAEVKKLGALVTELEPLDEEQRAKRALTSLQAWAKRHKRLVVLLVDNLNLVLERLSESHWALREALSSDNSLVVIGASATFLQETIDYQSPFYDFFHVHELGALSENDAREMVRSLARRANTPQVIKILERDPGRFKALYTLTGGTPRTLAVLHGVLTLDHGDRIERDLDGLLDQLTPYYKARFDDLPSQSQVIINAVALHWHPITAAQCQAATHLDLNTVSAQLNRLVKGGLLAKVALPDPGKLGFQLSERFFNIWYLMRASRRMRRRLSWFIEFLRIFYGEEERRRRAKHLIRRAPADTLSTPAQLLTTACRSLDLRGRDPSRRLVEMAIRDITTPGTMTELIVFFRRCISTRRGAQAVTLLQDSGMTEHLAPLYEALIAAAAGTRGRLDGLAPEVRTAAAAIYDQLCSAPTLGASGGLTASPGSLAASPSSLAASPGKGAPIEATVVSIPAVPVAARKRIKPGAKQRKASAGASARAPRRLPPPK
ncbi:MAG TPA: AAA family ATPase [Kofleriaceae bacterium]|jgi:hypothetical protein|nr:AAA family ATPase [Kofleriaceae bacterium]